MVVLTQDPKPTPSPTPQSAPNLPDLNSIVSAATSGTSAGTSSLYGLSKEAQAANFSVDGLPGLGSGQLSGTDLIDAFLAAGSNGNTAQSQIVAAIQHALLYSGYYSKDYTPNFGVAKKQDAEALSSAVNDLYHANQSRPQPQTLSQWLSGQSAIGATSGAFAAQATAPTVVNVRAPNSADVAAVYQKVAQQIEGHKPSSAELAAFVQNYTQSYVANERSNIQAQVDAAQQKAQVKQARNAQPPPPPPSYVNPGAGNLNPNVNQTPTGDASGNMNPAVQGGGPAPWDTPTPVDTPSLTDNMQTLQDIINQRAQPGSSASGGAPQVIEAGTSAPESVDVAAENFARNKNPKAAGATDLNNTFQTFLQLLSGKL